jgi:hypothetical protein
MFDGVIITNKNDKDNFGNNHNKKNRKKNHVEKHYNNPQCFVRKARVLTPHNLALLLNVVLN